MMCLTIFLCLRRDRSSSPLGLSR